MREQDLVLLDLKLRCLELVANSFASRFKTTEELFGLATDVMKWMGFDVK